MTRLLILLLISLLPDALAAQTVTVRSGEHGAFTRLVLTIPEGTDWEIAEDRDARRLSLSFSAGDLQFDTSRVFDRISTDRIAGVAPLPEGKGLDISLACNCTANSFVLRENMLVIDVAPDDGKPETEAPAARVGRLDTEKSLEPVETSIVRDLSKVRIGSLSGVGPEPDPNPLMPMLPAGQDNGPGANGADIARPATDGLGRQIASDLAIAATRGLLDPAVQFPMQQPKTDEKKPDPGSKSKEAPAPGEIARQLATGLSGLDDDTLLTGRISVGGDRCVADREVALHTWGDPEADPARYLAERRGKIFGEFDRIDRDALQNYALALLYYGFGAEARALLSVDDEAATRYQVSLSFLVDGDPDKSSSFSRNWHCDGYASFWSVLAQAPEKSATPVNISAVIRTLETIPKHLRSHLGPGLAEHLSEAGYQDGAREVLRRLERMEGHETDSISLAKAHLDAKDGKLASAGVRLHDLSVKGGSEAADAVVAAIELAEFSDSHVPERIVELSEAFATELRNSEDGKKLWQAYLRSLLVNRSFEAAFAELDAPHGMPEAVLEKTEEMAVRALLKDAGDVVFLKIATLRLDQDRLPGNDTLLVDLADRFSVLGLPDLAIKILDKVSEPDKTPKTLVVRAKALLALGRPEDAEIILIGQRGEDVMRLRAEARRQMGDHIFASTLFSEIGDSTAATNSAWLSGDWKGVAESDSVLAPAADLMQRDPVAASTNVERLGDIDALYSDTAKSRETLRALLDATALESGRVDFR